MPTLVNRFGQHAGNVAGRQRLLERGDIVEFDDRVVTEGSTGGPMLPRARLRDAVWMQGDESFVHRAVIAPVEDENLRTAGDLARQTNRKAIGVGGGECKLPVGQAEALLQFFGDKDRVFRSAA